MLTAEREQRINELLEKNVLSRNPSEFRSSRGIIASYCCDDPRFLGCYLYTLTRVPLVHVISLHGAGLFLATKARRFEHERRALLTGVERARLLTGYRELLCTVHDHCKMGQMLGIEEPDELVEAAKQVALFIETQLPIKVHTEMQVYPSGNTPVCFTENPPKFGTLGPDGVIEVRLPKRFEIYRIVR